VYAHRPRGLLLALVSSLALTATAPAGAAVQEGEPSPRTLVEQIRKHRATTWHWQRVMGKKRTPAGFAGRRDGSLDQLVRIREAWHRHALAVKRRARQVPNRGAWRCIKTYEGSWTDPDAPYWGGLQMDYSFQRTYGPYLLRKKGTANRWRPKEQMWTAEKARRSGRGFHPWPNTARRCGLI
jgi:hypothetical protein